MIQNQINFDGATFVKERDGKRLGKQLQDVFRIVSSGKPYTLSELEELTGHPTNSISSRLRDLRKHKFGHYKIDRNYVGNGLYIYTFKGKDVS